MALNDHHPKTRIYRRRNSQAATGANRNQVQTEIRREQAEQTAAELKELIGEVLDDEIKIGKAG